MIQLLFSPHLLAPTASDLVKYGKKDSILAGFHTDLNFLTIHGRSRYPGLNIWARNTGKRIPVKFPATGRYLLVQAGKQLEHLSGGLIKAGYHEVVVNDATLAVSSRYNHNYFVANALRRLSSAAKPKRLTVRSFVSPRLSSGICRQTSTLLLSLLCKTAPRRSERMRLTLASSTRTLNMHL